MPSCAPAGRPYVATLAGSVNDGIGSAGRPLLIALASTSWSAEVRKLSIAVRWLWDSVTWNET